MLKIRLQRVGKKHDPNYRVVLVDSRRAAKSGSFLEILGNYTPKKGEPQFKAERIREWISKGAQISPTLNNLLISKKVIIGRKISVFKPKKKKDKDNMSPQPLTESNTGV